MRALRPRRGSLRRYVVLLGPQADRPTAALALRDLEAAGRVSAGSPLAVITAGWRDREGEAGIVEPEIAGRAVDLELYRRAERVAEADPELARAHRDVQNRLKLLRRAYNVRLAGLIEAHQRLSELNGDEAVMSDERADALEAIRALDHRHLDRVVGFRGEFEAALAPAERDAVRVERREIDRALDGAEAVVIAGGHVATLLNRLRLFGGADLFGQRPLIAWSAGAMALSSRVVLFHDRPPWGAGYPEAFDPGLGVVAGVVPLPNATDRLTLDDRARTARLAARFAPAACVLLDPGARIDWIDGTWKGQGRVRRLDRAGRQIRFRASAA